MHPDAWFLGKVLRLLVHKFRDVIYMERYIMKPTLYREFSWAFRFSREDTRAVLSMLARECDGVRFSNRGLFVPREYVENSCVRAGGRNPSHHDRAYSISSMEDDKI